MADDRPFPAPATLEFIPCRDEIIPCSCRAGNYSCKLLIYPTFLACNSTKTAFFPVLFPVSRELLLGRPVSADCVRHQEVAANRPGFPAPTIPRLFSALARKLERIAFGSTRPIVAALGERGHAVNDRVYKVRFDGTAICSNGLRGLFCWDDGPWRANAEMSLRRRILGSRLRGCTDQRDREPFGFAISVRRAPLAPTPTIGLATPMEGPSGA